MGLEPTERNRLLAARVIASALSNPSQEFTPEALADATGLSKNVVRQIFVDEDFRTMLQRACADEALGVLTKAVRQIDRRIISNPDSREQHLIQATNVLVKAYGDLSKSDGHNSGQSAEDFRALLATMKPADVTVSRLLDESEKEEAT